MVRQKRQGGTWYYQFIKDGTRYTGRCEGAKTKRGKVRHGGSLTGTLFSTDPPLGLSWKGGFSELRNFPRFFHDFSTIRVTKHKKSPCFIVYEKW